LPTQKALSIVNPVAHRVYLITVLGGLGLIGLQTILLTQAPVTMGMSQALWIIFLILLPLGLIGPVWMTWRWSAMVCVVYGTIGLALDLATLVSIATHLDGEMPTAVLSGLSGFANFLLILFGGRSFLHLPPELSPPGSHPPNPPSPF
jgi:hypothetical protein